MSTPLATTWEDLGSLRGPAGPSGPTPARRLNIGPLAGQNHFALQLAQDGAPAISTIGQDELAAGFDLAPYYALLADESAVTLRASVGGPTTSGTTYARCELRELALDGRNAAWDPFVGTHRLRGRTRITRLPANKPELVLAQLHNGTTDRVAIRTQLISGQVKLLVRINGTAATPRLSETYVVGTEIEWMIEVVAGEVRVYYGDMVTPIITSNALVPTAGGATWYFKTGAYLQSDTSTDLATEYGAVELRGLSHWHTGWPDPRDRAGVPRHGDTHAPGGSDAPVGWAADAAVVHNTGAETISGIKTVPAGSTWIFNAPPQVAQGTAANHPVRRDDARLTDARAPLPIMANVANGWVQLDSGALIPAALLPQLAITDVFPVNSQAAMLALTAQRGDVAVRSDVPGTFILAAEPASTLGNWVLLPTPTDAVLSVAGRTGAVTLAKADVGLGNVSNLAPADLPVSTAAQAALDAKRSRTPLIASVGDVAAAGTLTVAAVAGTDVYRGRLLGSTATLAEPSGAVDGMVVNLELYATVTTVLTFGSALLEAGGIPASVSIPAGKLWSGALRYRAATSPATSAAAWRVLASSVDN